MITPMQACQIEILSLKHKLKYKSLLEHFAYLTPLGCYANLSRLDSMMEQDWLDTGCSNNDMADDLDALAEALSAVRKLIR